MSVTHHRIVPTRSILQLRMLVANDQRRLDELSAAMESMDITELNTAWLVRCEEAEARLQHHQRLLSAYLLASPAAPAPLRETLAGSLVTTSAAQPV